MRLMVALFSVSLLKASRALALFSALSSVAVLALPLNILLYSSADIGRSISLLRAKDSKLLNLLARALSTLVSFFTFAALSFKLSVRIINYSLCL